MLIYAQIVYEHLFSQKSFHVVYINYFILAGIAAYLLSLLGLCSVSDTTRYQLLHRTASAIIEARRFNAAHAVMLVHSFSQSSEWFQDYAAFVSLMGGIAKENGIVSVGARSGVPLHLAWVRGNAQYLSK